MFRRVSLTTDFGAGSWYVPAMKGALWQIAPAAELVDLSHTLPPQNLLAAAFFLGQALPAFGPDTLHVAVIDPGVGSDRAALAVRWAAGTVLLPDNGLATFLLRTWGEPTTAVRLDQPAFWRGPLSATFHGRDLFAPVAGHLWNGIPLESLGSPAGPLMTLATPQPTRTASGWSCTIIVVDDYGNLVTDLPADAAGDWTGATLPDGTVARRVRTYADARPGDTVALVGSHGHVEVAVVNGSAAATHGTHPGDAVNVEPG